MWRCLLTIAGILLGARYGIRMLLPPPDPGLVCGLPVLPALFVGAPAGAILGALIGWSTGGALDWAAGRALDRVADDPAVASGKPKGDVIDRELA